MHANRDSIMKPAAAVQGYAGQPKSQCQNPPACDFTVRAGRPAARFMFRSQNCASCWLHKRNVLFTGQ
jgi:hypothetical protein